MKFLAPVKKWVRLLNPTPPVGGLAATSNSVRFLRIKDRGAFQTAALRLPPGIVAEGKIKDVQAFTSALKAIHSRVAPPDKTVHVILNLPPDLVYTQSFFIPLLAESRIDEAARLNLEMLSPIDVKTSYASWQKIGESFSGSAQLELLGAFAEAEPVNAFSQALRESGFAVAAIEFPALSIARLVKSGAEAKEEKSYLVIDVAGEGVSFMILRNLNLYFNHFHSWQSIEEESGGKRLSVTDFKDFLLREVQKVSNFYGSRWGGAIGEAVLLASSMGKEITEVIETNFPMQVTDLALGGEHRDLGADWFSVLGSAVRGLMPRHRDSELSLTTAPVKLQYWHALILNFTGIWRKVALTVFGFLIAMTLIADLFLLGAERSFKAGRIAAVGEKELQDAESLRLKAAEFNRLVGFALKAAGETSAWSPVFARIDALSGNGTVIRRAVLDRFGIVLTGSASDEGSVIAFKDRLLGVSDFAEVSLPLANLRPNPDGTVNFTITVRTAAQKQRLEEGRSIPQ